MEQIGYRLNQLAINKFKAKRCVFVMYFKNIMIVANSCKYSIFFAKIYKYVFIDSFQASAGILDSAEN